MKRLTALILALLTVFSLCGCGASTAGRGKESYKAGYEKVMIPGGEVLAENTSSNEITFSIDGNKVVFSYYGEKHTGHYIASDSTMIEWDEAFYMLGDGPVLSSYTNEVSMNGKKMGHNLYLTYMYGSTQLIHVIELR